MKRYSLILTLLLTISFFANAWKDGYYQLKLINVDTNDQVEGEFNTDKNKFGIDNSTYEDDFININFTIHPTHISFILNNKTDSKMKLNWDESVFSGLDGNSEPVFHDGTKYSKKEETQVSTTIMKGGKIDDIIAPKSHADWSSKYKRWVHTYILRWGRKINSGAMGNTISVQLPIDVNGKIIDYVFTFECSWHELKVKTRIINGLEYYRAIK